VKKINSLVKEIERVPFEGSGKPEPLKHNLAGWCTTDNFRASAGVQN